MSGQVGSVLGGTQPTSEDQGVAIHSFDASRSGLDAFEPERAAPDSADVAAASDGQSKISLAQLKATGVLFDQNDAVAIGQALCRVFIGSQVRRRMNPLAGEPETSARMTTESVQIDSAGRVRTSIGDLDDEATAVNDIGRVLSEILPPGGRSFLRTKIISKAVASPPEFMTVDELSHALAPMGRPDGREVIRGIFQLWQHVSHPVAFPLVEKERPPTPVPSEADPRAPERKIGPQPPSKRRQLVLVTAIIGGGVLSFLIGVFVLFNWFSPVPPAQVAAVPTATADPRAASESQASGNDRNGVAFMGPRGPASQPSTPRSTPATPRRVATAAIPSDPAPADVPVVPVVPVTMIATASDVTWRPVDPQENRSARPTNVAAAGTRKAPSGASGGFVGTPVRSSEDMAPLYTAKDLDVVPPAPILPRLLGGLRPSSPGIRPRALTIAVIVAPDGSVESVRGLVTPQSMGETVVLTEALSAVKSWRFTPATKDGEPVKYEQIVPLTALMRPTR